MTASTRYTYTAMLLHWLIAAVMTVNVALILAVDLFPEALVRPVIDTHKSLGITVLGLGLLRLLWRATHPPPPLPADAARWERFAAHAAHAALYALIIALPISGWLHDSAWKDAAAFPMRLYGLLPWPRIGLVASLDPAFKEALHTWLGRAHTLLAYGLYVLLALHVLGALKHQFVDRQAQMQRILPWGRIEPG
jgi:cytochrome b561